MGCSSKNTRLAQWSLTGVESIDWLVAVVLVVGESGAEGTEGGMSENVADDVDVGD